MIPLHIKIDTKLETLSVRELKGSSNSTIIFGVIFIDY